MTTATKIVFIAALILSIIIPFGYYLIGEKNKNRYKTAIGVNAFFFFGASSSCSSVLGSFFFLLPVAGLTVGPLRSSL